MPNAVTMKKEVQQIKKRIVTERKAVLVLLLLTLAFVVLNLTQDFVKSTLKNSAFYFSESLIYSSFWWIFMLQFWLQYLVVKRYTINKTVFTFTIILVPIVIHLLAFPSTVWMLSKMFYYHTYSFQQVLRYTLSEQLYLVILLYAMPIFILKLLTKKQFVTPQVSDSQNVTIETTFITNLLVSERNTKNYIATSEIVYLSANTPYIDIHLENKKYLHHETLKSIATQLNPNQFIRIHKSTIVNISKTTSYKTRFNGDYDLRMENGVQLRVSRNFASHFKTLFNKAHRLTAK